MADAKASFDPWSFLLPILGSLAYNMLFGGTGDQRMTQETVTETPPTGFKDPGLGLLSPLLLGQLSQNWGRFANFGVPEGGQMTPFLGGGNLDSLLKLLQGEYEGISKEYGAKGNCEAECNKLYPGDTQTSKIQRDSCLRRCQAEQNKGA